MAGTVLKLVEPTKHRANKVFDLVVAIGADRPVVNSHHSANCERTYLVSILNEAGVIHRSQS